jgi:hypothetical protein
MTNRYGDEAMYRERYNLNDGQLAWRRYQIENNFNGNLLDFMQEYPASLEECFISSGMPVFDLQRLSEIEQGIIRSSIVERRYNIVGSGLVENIDGECKVYRDYVSGFKYRYICVLDTGGVWDGADYSVALVYDRVAREVVAVLRGHYNSYDFAEKAVVLCRRYGNAELVIEINKWGSETDDEMSLLNRVINHIQYDNLYRRTISYDQLTNKIVRKVGFHTNSSTKRMIVEKLLEVVSEVDSVQFNDVEIVREMRTYVIGKSKSGNTTYQAQEGCKDDRVMAMGIALLVDSEIGVPVADDVVESRKWTGDSIY